MEDVLSGNWGSTVYSEHPGVTLMWPAGIGLKLYWALSGIKPAAKTVPPDFEPIHFFGPVPQAEIAAALIPLALLIGLGIVGAYLLLRRLFDEATASVAGLLLALSPYYLAQSKILHLDATMATLMLLSALALLVYRRERHGRRCGSLPSEWRWLLLSGALGGLALLTKIPAAFLVPFCGLVLLVDITFGAKPAASCPRFHVTRSVVPRLILPFLAWLTAAAVVYVALWPAMWVAPGKGLAAVRWGITQHATTAHDSPTLFLGQVMREDPGPLFYVVSLLFRTSEIELTFLTIATLLGIVSLVPRRSPSTAGRGQRARTSRLSDRTRNPSIDYLLLAAYATLYIAQMSLGAKKMPRYVLPSLLAWNILAAVGMIAWIQALAKGHQRVKVALLVMPILVQAGLTLSRHPYYGTALNWLAGGPPAAAEGILIGEEGEGYAELTAYLNTRPDAEDLTVAAQLKHVFNQTFRGTTVEIDQGEEMTAASIDYLAFHRNYTARDYKVEEWGRVWERYAARTPEREVTFDGVPYAWLYATLPPGVGPEHAQMTRLGESFQFLGYDRRETEATPGDHLPVVLYWRATEPVTEDLSIFLHLLDSEGELIWQDDGAADHGERPTWSWAPGETVLDPHTVSLPSDLAAGEYLLTTGLYDWRTAERLSAYRSDGTQLTADQVPVATLTVRQHQALTAVWVARGLAVLTGLLALVAQLGRPSSQLLSTGSPASPDATEE
jgi:hypothetical protein